jgi:plasmid stabilization system protein ParE
MDESIAWYEHQRHGLGVDFAIQIGDTLQRISTAPQQFPLVRGEIRRGLVPRFPYAVHFMIEDARIIILAVFHAKRSPRLLERR